MSIYRINKILFLLETDAAFLERFRADPGRVLAEFDLTDEERTAFLAGDVGKMYLMGVHTFLMNVLSRQGLLGLNRDSYLQRVRAAAAQADQKQG